MNVATAITELGVGEALVSFLDEKGVPTPVERAFVCPPQSRIGALTDAERAAVIANSSIKGFYEKQVDRESAYEILKTRATESAEVVEEESKGFDWGGMLGGILGGKKNSRSDSILESAAKSTARSIGSQLGRSIVRGVLGSILGGRK